MNSTGSCCAAGSCSLILILNFCTHCRCCCKTFHTAPWNVSDLDRKLLQRGQIIPSENSKIPHRYQSGLFSLHLCKHVNTFTCQVTQRYLWSGKTSVNTANTPRDAQIAETAPNQSPNEVWFLNLLALNEETCTCDLYGVHIQIINGIHEKIDFSHLPLFDAMIFGCPKDEELLESE